MTEDSVNQQQPKPRGQRFIKILLLGCALIILLGIAGKWLYFRHNHISSEDAQVATNEITVSSRLAGRISLFDQRRGNSLHKGDVIAELDTKPATLKLAQMQENLASMKALLAYQQQAEQLAKNQQQGGIQEARAQVKRDQARIAQARAERDKAAHTYQRENALFKKSQISAQKKDEAYYDLQSAQAALTQAKQQIKIDQIALANAQLGLLSNPMMLLPNPHLLDAKQAITQKNIAAAEAQVAHQLNQIHDLTVRAPQNGVVDQTFTQPGEFISPGQPILMMHSVGDVWVRVLLKETQVGKVRVGQQVALHVDAFPDQTFSGHVEVIGHAATNQFALLPDPNPSGNFTKITQRIPVRVKIDKGPKEKLAPGMMVEATLTIAKTH